MYVIHITRDDVRVFTRAWATTAAMKSATVGARPLHPAQYLRWSDAERVCKTHDHSEGGTLDPTLNCAQISAVNAKLHIDVHLRQASRISNLPQHNPKSLFRP